MPLVTPVHLGRYLYGGSGSLPSPLVYARNGVAPSGEGVSRYAGEYANALLCGRVKIPFTKWIDPTNALNLAADTATWRFAFHSSPLTRRLRIRMILGPVGSNFTPNAGIGAQAYWVSETGLTGVGTTTTHNAVVTFASSSTSNTPDDWQIADVDCSISGDTDYRFTLHQVNGAQVLGATAYEVERTVLETSRDTTSVAGWGEFLYGRPITDSQYQDLATAISALWRRQGAQLGAYTVDKTTAITRTSATYANALDGSTAYAAYSADPTTLGWIVHPEYRQSLGASVNVTGYCYASVAGGGSGNVRFVNGSGALATIAISGSTPTWYSGTFTLSGSDATDKIDVHINGDGANAVSLYACGAFVYDS